jgi:hypothetical protein
MVQVLSASYPPGFWPKLSATERWAGRWQFNQARWPHAARPPKREVQSARPVGRRKLMPGDRDRQRDPQLERMREAVDRKAEAARARAEEESLEAPDRPQEQMVVRAKSSGHKKKTADKWNQ